MTALDRRPEAPARSDRLVARAALLSLGELGSGWRPTTAVGGRRCQATERAWRTARATASSAFALYRNVLQQTVTVFADERAARRDFAALESVGALRCLYRELHRGIETTAGAHVSHMRTIRVEEETAQTSATRAATTVDSPIGPASVYIDQVRTWAQRGVSVAVLVQVGSPVEESVYDTLVARLKRRLETSVA